MVPPGWGLTVAGKLAVVLILCIACCMHDSSASYTNKHRQLLVTSQDLMLFGIHRHTHMHDHTVGRFMPMLVPDSQAELRHYKHGALNCGPDGMRDNGQPAR